MYGKISVNSINRTALNGLSVRLLFYILSQAESASSRFGAMLGDIELTQLEVAKELYVSRQTISKHLSELENAGLIYCPYGKIKLNSDFYFAGSIDLMAIKDFTALSPAINLLFHILLCTYRDCTLKVTKNDFAKYLKKSRTSVTTYLLNYVQAGLMKFKYNGEIMVNPDFYYNGEINDLNAVRQNYINFKSGMST